MPSNFVTLHHFTKGFTNKCWLQIWEGANFVKQKQGSRNPYGDGWAKSSFLIRGQINALNIEIVDGVLELVVFVSHVNGPAELFTLGLVVHLFDGHIKLLTPCH
jgi:hypothetical protein